MTPDARFCFAWYAGETLAGSQERAALLKGNKWPSGAVITVSFLGGEIGLRDKVKTVARRWTAPGMANLNLDFRTSNDTDVRIAFVQGNGSWSTLGTTCRRVPKGEPTMNYGWLTTGSSDLDIQEVVLHEFGHALGLIHEHQNPAGGIKWNKEKIYAELSSPPNNWNKATIDSNMFEAYRTSETNFTSVDAASIMMYPIPRSWTLDGFSVGSNTDLSPTDKKFIRQQYP